jgi:hypothetical protein
MRWFYAPAYQSAYRLTNDEMHEIEDRIDNNPRGLRPPYRHVKHPDRSITIYRPTGRYSCHFTPEEAQPTHTLINAVNHLTPPTVNPRELDFAITPHETVIENHIDAILEELHRKYGEQ